jgi:glycerate-2-kinase
MKIINERELLENASFRDDKGARAVAIKVLEAALNAVDPRKAVKQHVRKVGSFLVVGDELKLDLKKIKRVFVVGCGKASGAMAEALEEILQNKITEGFVNILRGTRNNFKTRRIFLNEASHPVPDEKGLEGSKRIVELVGEARRDDLVFCLISGGGSALMPLPAADITLKDKQRLTEVLLTCGASITEINAVRKHISLVKGGQLARSAYPATLISLILSDVVGDPLDVIASGPTAPDETTFQDAVNTLKRYNLWRNIPNSIKRRLKAGLKGKISETPKPGDKIFERTHNVIIGNNRLAALAACKEARKLGFKPFLLSTMIEGEARHVGTVFAGIIKEIKASDHPVKKPAAVVAGGETTVAVTGQGKGGRNQELVLSASLKISGLKGVAIASIGTDGIDGSTDAAGAIADGQTMARAQEMKLDPKEFLRNNDSYTFFSKLNDLIFTGPTGTCVNDITVMIIA